MQLFIAWSRHLIWEILFLSLGTLDRRQSVSTCELLCLDKSPADTETHKTAGKNAAHKTTNAVCLICEAARLTQFGLVGGSDLHSSASQHRKTARVISRERFAPETFLRKGMDAKHLLAKKGSLFGQSKNVCPKKQTGRASLRPSVAYWRLAGNGGGICRQHRRGKATMRTRASVGVRIVAGAAHRDSDGLKLHVAAALWRQTVNLFADKPRMQDAGWCTLHKRPRPSATSLASDSPADCDSPARGRRQYWPQ